jgi:hypothetical protein
MLQNIMPGRPWDLDHKHDDDDDDDHDTCITENYMSKMCSKLVPAIIISELTGGPGRP